MRPAPFGYDGQVVTAGSHDFELRTDVNEDVGSCCAVCQSCGITVAASDIAMAVHECVTCCRCGSVCVDVVYDEMQQSYLPPKRWDAWCSDDCHDATAEASARSAS